MPMSALLTNSSAMWGAGRAAGISPPTSKNTSAISAMVFFRMYEAKKPVSSVVGTLVAAGKASTIWIPVRETSG